MRKKWVNRLCALTLAGTMTLGLFPGTGQGKVDAATSVTNEKVICQVDFSGANVKVGGSIAQGATSFAQVTNMNAPDKRGTIVVEDEDGKYGRFFYTQGVEDSTAMMAFNYGNVPKESNLHFQIKARLHDYSSDVTWQYRMKYTNPATGGEAEYTIKLLVSSKGTLSFLGKKFNFPTNKKIAVPLPTEVGENSAAAAERPDAAVSGPDAADETAGNGTDMAGEAAESGPDAADEAAGNGTDTVVSGSDAAVNGQNADETEADAAQEWATMATYEKMPKDEWVEFDIYMDTTYRTATLKIGDQVVQENVSYVDSDFFKYQDFIKENCDFRMTVKKTSNDKKNASTVDLGGMTVSAISTTVFDPWERIQLTDTQTALVNALLAGVEERSFLHPYLFFTEDQLPDLQKKIESGRAKEAFTLLKQMVAEMDGEIDVDTYTFTASADGKHKAATLGRRLQKELGYLAFYDELTGETSHKQKAHDLLLKAVKDVDPGYANSSVNDALGVGDFLYAYVLGYDWLYDTFTPEEKAEVEKAIVDFCIWVYENSFTQPFGAETNDRLAWNWNTVTHGSLGMAALCLDEGAIEEDVRREWLSRAVQRVEGYCRESKDATGLSYEGASYLGYGMQTIVAMSSLINFLMGNGYNWLEQFDHLKQVAVCQMWMNAPYANGEAYYWNQANVNTHISTVFYLINLFRDRLGLWGFDELNYFENWETLDLQWDGNGCQLPQIICFEDQSLTPEKPSSDTLLKQFEQGVVVGRDGWDDLDSMFGFVSRVSLPSVWTHDDVNSFAFWAKGEAFIVDLGPGTKPNNMHNVLMVDGAGPSNKGSLEKVEDLGNTVYVLGNAGNCYNKAQTATRQVIYGRGKDPYLFVYDDYAASAGGNHTYSICNYTKTANQIELLPEIQGAKIVGANRGAQCFVLFFGQADVDVVDSSVIDAQGNVSYRSFTASTEGETLNLGSLFLAADRYGRLPVVEKTEIEGKTAWKLYLSDHRLDIITVADGKVSSEESSYAALPQGDQVIDLNEYAVKLESISVTEQPAKVDYVEGEYFDPAGMVVTAHFSDTSEMAVEDYQIRPERALKVGDETVTVVYQMGDIVKEAVVEIHVTPKDEEKEPESSEPTEPSSSESGSDEPTEPSSSEAESSAPTETPSSETESSAPTEPSTPESESSASAETSSPESENRAPVTGDGASLPMGFLLLGLSVVLTLAALIRLRRQRRI